VPRAPHRAAVSASMAIPHTRVAGFRALDAVTHPPAAVSGLQAAPPPAPPVVPDVLSMRLRRTEVDENGFRQRRR